MLLENVSLWKKKYPTHGKPIYLGISQGGDMCFTLAAKYSDQFELCIPAAGRLFAEEITKKRDSGKIRIHQGEADLIVSVESARQAAKRLSLAKFDVEIQEYEGVGHGVNAEMSKAIQADINTVLEP
jgi:predicted esterase